MPNEAPLETLEGREVGESCSGVSPLGEEHTRAAAAGSVCLNWTETGPGPTALYSSSSWTLMAGLILSC